LGFLLSVAAASVCSGWIFELPDQKRGFLFKSFYCGDFLNVLTRCSV
jgi:hypothetical protein